MKYRIVLTDQADSDLRSIYEYIACVLLEPGIAAGQLDRIEKGILSLDVMPERYCVFGKEPWQSRGLRKMPVDNYIVFYIPKLKEKLVYVIRVMYGGRNIEEQLRRIKT